jgi:hypothetical protein
MRVFENRVLIRISGSKEKEEVTGECRILHNEEIHNLYPQPNIVNMIKSRSMRYAEHIVCMGEMRNVYKILVGKPEDKRQFERTGRR